MKFYKFTAIFAPEKDAPNVYNASVPVLPGCFSFGDSFDEAKYNIREAVELYLLSILDNEQKIPQDKKIKLPKNAIAQEITVGVDFEIKTGFFPTISSKKSSVSYVK
ncbi:type II toxin-antitoxin system HicB family antitoxin [Candidatus Wolfebacteria bacterium]|nr:type II toxin-antitoxin system HicB family antitoxin [Candidatus Wolfebacteria bacterium]